MGSGPLDLSPAKWLWYPGDRTLPNTFVLFRRVLRLDAKPRKATGWIIGESRYQLEVNGKRIQWGPAPNDPRWPEVDHMDLTEVLTSGENVLGATVLYFGQGDATCPMSRAGFIFKLEIEHADGRREIVVSDGAWRCHLSQAWKPGIIACFSCAPCQEEFDGRLHPHGWNEKGFVENDDWLAPYLSAVPGESADLCRPDERSDELDSRSEEVHLRRGGPFQVRTPPAPHPPDARDVGFSGAAGRAAPHQVEEADRRVLRRAPAKVLRCRGHAGSPARR